MLTPHLALDHFVVPAMELLLHFILVGWLYVFLGFPG